MLEGFRDSHGSYLLDKKLWVQIPYWHLGRNPKLTLHYKKESTRCYSS